MNEITCDWCGPPSKVNTRCRRSARYFYIDDWDNVVARCHEHFFNVKKQMTKPEYIVHSTMDE